VENAVERGHTHAMTASESDGRPGHAAHVRPAEDQEGLPGAMPRPIVITFLGAGSMFCPELCRDVLQIPGNERGELRLVDVDEIRLGLMHRVIERLVTELGRPGWIVRSTTDRREVLAGTDYAVCSIEVSGVDCVGFDNDIPLEYGVDQCIGDTVGPGGLFKGLRTIPVLLDILRDMAELCPHAVMLNYTNPMAIVCSAAARAVPQVPFVGLCHSVQGSQAMLALRLGVPHTALEWSCAGINHLSWFTTLRLDGVDQYPRLMAQARAELFGDPAESDNAWPPDVGKDRVRKDVMLHFGAFVTESSGHLSEYLPHYRTRPEGRAFLGDGYDGESRFYASNWPRWRDENDRLREQMVAGTADFDLRRSWEYASWIIEAREKGVPFRFHGNVPNSAGEAGRLVTNLPGDACVEVACVADGNGITPVRFGALPSHMAHVCASNIAMQDLAATAAVERDREVAVQSLLLDPLTRAVLTPGEIREMTDRLFEAEAAYLPGY
jgi:alpha-galactosidase